MVKKILNPETGRMVNLTGKIGQKVLSQHGGGDGQNRRVEDARAAYIAARQRRQQERKQQAKSDKYKNKKGNMLEK